MRTVKSKKTPQTISEHCGASKDSFQKMIEENKILLQKYNDYAEGKIQLTEQDAIELQSKVMHLL